MVEGVRRRAISPARLWKMRVRFEDVEACLENAVDLTDDAKRCESPAGIALAELSLEQASLTALLWGRYLLDKDGISARLQRGEVCFPPYPTSLAIVAICSDPRRFTDPEIIEASWDHDASIRHVDTALGLLQELADYLFNPKSPAKVPGHVFPIAQRVSRRIHGKKEFVRRGRAEFEAFIDRARIIELPRLPDLKKETLYARVNRETGQVSIPEEVEGLFESIVEIATLLEEVVGGALETEQRLAKSQANVAKVVELLKRADPSLGKPSSTGHS